MKKMLTTVFIFAIMVTMSSAGILFVNFVKANPYPDKFVTDEGAPPEGTIPPVILIFSPNNNTAYASNNISLAFNVSLPESNNGSLVLSEVYYKASWQSINTYVDLESIYSQSFSINLTGVLEGPRWLEIYAVGQGGNITREVCDFPFSTIYQVIFKLTGSSIVNFTIDTTPPKVSILSLENKTYSTSAIPLNFMTNERISHSTYSLDGQENVTITGNTTLNRLANGDHNVTVYATDEAGNLGASATIYFSVEIPFPTTLVLATVATVAVIGVGLLVHFKKRHGNRITDDDKQPFQKN